MAGSKRCLAEKAALKCLGQERLATVDHENGGKVVRICKSKSAEVETELKVPGRNYY